MSEREKKIIHIHVNYTCMYVKIRHIKIKIIPFFSFFLRACVKSICICIYIYSRRYYSTFSDMTRENK